MLKFLNLQPEIFGLDINDSYLRLVKLKKTRRGFVVESFQETPIKHGIIKEGVILHKEGLIEIIRQACKKVNGRKLATKHVIISLPEEKSFSQVIQMPRMTHEELISAVPFEAENYIPIPINKVYLDFEVINSLGKDQSHLSILINGIPKFIVDAYVDCAKRAGLIPRILEVESQAIARSLMYSIGDQKFSGNLSNKGAIKKSLNLPLIIIDFGVANTNLIIWFNGGVRFTCSISISSSQLTRAIADNFGVSILKAERLKIKQGLNKANEHKYNIEKAMSPILHELVLQIKKYVDFYYGHVSLESSASDVKIEKIILSGGGANLKKLPAFLQKELKIPVEIGNPFINILPQKTGNANNIPYEKILSFTTALGLALRAASDTDGA